MSAVQDGAVTYDHFERTVTMLMERQDTMHADMVRSLREAVAAGVVQGHVAVAEDPKASAAYWGAAYLQLRKQAHDDVSMSVGKRLVSWMSTALIGIGVGLAFWNMKGGK